jgi:hypothetical protein
MRMGNNQQTLIDSTQGFLPLADHSIFGECSGTTPMYVVNEHSNSLHRSCRLVPKLQQTDKNICKFSLHICEGISF